MVAEKNYLVSTLKEAGVRSQVYTSKKKLKQANELHTGAVLYNGDRLSRSGSKRKYTDQEGRQKLRVKLWDRETSFHVVIADTTAEKTEEILDSFLRRLKKGIPIDGNWVGIDAGEVDWVDEADSILKAKVAVQFDVTFTGGIYEDRDIRPVTVSSVETEKEDTDGRKEDGRAPEDD